MASIVNVVIEYDSGGKDRRITYSVTLQDNDGQQTTVKHGPVVTDENFDAAAFAVTLGERKLAGFIEQEASNVEAALESDALSAVTAAKWAEPKDVARALILHMIRERDPRIVVALEPLIQYLQANYTVTQMANWLGLTVAQILKINRRVNAILSDVGTVKNLLVAFDAEQDEFE